MAPDGWRELEVQDVARVILGQSPPSAEVTEEPSSEENEIPFLQGNAEFKDRFPSASSWIRTPPRTAPQDSILISVRAPVGDVNQADEEYGIGRGLAAVAANGDGGALKDYLFWALSNAQAYYTSRKQGTTFDAIKKKDLKELPLNLPPLPEQKEIAAILSSVDDAIAATRKVIEQTKRVKKGLLQDLMTRGIGHTRFKQTAIGKIPEEWEVVRLRTLLNSRTYGISSSLSSDPVGTPILRMNNLRDGRLDLSDIKYADLSDQDRDKAFVQPGDILFNRTNSVDLVGLSALVDTEAELGYASYLIRLRTNDGVDPRWLTSFMNSWQGQAIIGRLIKPSVSQANINPTELARSFFPLPPRAEQEKISDILDTLRAKLERSNEVSAELQTLKRGLMQDLLTGRVRVPVD